MAATGGWEARQEARASVQAGEERTDRVWGGKDRAEGRLQVPPQVSLPPRGLHGDRAGWVPDMGTLPSGESGLRPAGPGCQDDFTFNHRERGGRAQSCETLSPFTSVGLAGKLRNLFPKAAVWGPGPAPFPPPPPRPQTPLPTPLCSAWLCPLNRRALSDATCPSVSPLLRKGHEGHAPLLKRGETEAQGQE